jgi:hypothetical protein
VSPGEGDQEPGKASRRSRALRVGFLLALGLGLAALLLAAFAFSLLHTPPGTLATRVFLEQWGSRATGGTLRIRALELALWKGEAAATGASLILDGTTVEAPRVEVAWSPGARPRVRVVRPSVVVRDTGETETEEPPATGLAAQPWRVIERLAAAEVAEGRLELRDARGVPWLVLGRLDASVVEDRGRRRVSARVADAGLGWPGAGLRVRPAAADATLAVDGGRLVVEQATFTSGASSVVVRGGLDRLSPATAAGWAHGIVDAGIAGALAPGAELAGRVDANVTVEVKDDAVSGTLRAASRALTVQGIGPWEVGGNGAFDGEQLVLEAFEARGLDGRLAAEGPLALRTAAREPRVSTWRFSPRRSRRRTCRSPRAPTPRCAGRRPGGTSGRRKGRARSGCDPRAGRRGPGGPWASPSRALAGCESTAEASPSRGCRSRRAARGSPGRPRWPPAAPSAPRGKGRCPSPR